MIAREQAVIVGSRRSMVGILSPARGDGAGGEKPAVVILNAGIIHRVGPNRMHVELARALASLGYATLRFDLSGIGDSDKRNDGLSPLEASLADIREAVDWLQAARGHERLVLVGLCSGADHGLIYAGSDARVAGLVLLDPSIPRTTGHYLRYFGQRILQSGRWRDVGGALGKLVARLAGSRQPDPRPEDYQARPALDSKEVRAYLSNAYRKALEQDIAFLTVFTGDRDHLYNYRNQMLDALKGLRFGNRLQLEYFAGCDHTFCSEAERGRLVKLVADWIEARKFVAAPAGQAAVPPPPPLQSPLPLPDRA